MKELIWEQNNVFRHVWSVEYVWPRNISHSPVYKDIKPQKYNS